jgi:hypothetical protein
MPGLCAGVAVPRGGDSSRTPHRLHKAQPASRCQIGRPMIWQLGTLGSRCGGQSHRNRRRQVRNDVAAASFEARLGRPGWMRTRSGGRRWRMTGMTCSFDSYPLCWRLYCVCGERFFPSSATDSTREYMTVCGCRLRPIDAVTVERRVYAQAAHLSSLATDRWRRRTVESLARFCARIEVGGTADDVRLLPPEPRPLPRRRKGTTGGAAGSPWTAPTTPRLATVRAAPSTRC